MSPLKPVYSARPGTSGSYRPALAAKRLLWPLCACFAVGCGRHNSIVVTPSAPQLRQQPVPNKIASSPHDPAARLQLAEQYARDGDTFAAIEQLEVVRAGSGGYNDDVALRLAGLYDTAGEPEAAADVLAAVAGRSAAVAVTQAYSRELLKLGEFDRAAAAAAPLVAQWPSLPKEVRQGTVRTLLLAGEAERAGKLIPVETDAASDPEWLALRGLQLKLSGQPKAAAAILARAVAADPQRSRNAFWLGDAWLAAGDAGRALAAWRAAAQLPDAPPQAAIGAARLLIQASRYDEAAMLMQRIGGTARALPAYWEVQALLAQKAGQPTLVQIARGYAAYHSGDPWQAEAIWRAALSRAKAEDAWAIYTALLNSAAQRQDRASLNYATEATKRFPNDYYLLKSRAELLLEQNARAEALGIAQRLVAIEPPDRAGQAAELLARIALRSGKADLLQQSVQREREQAPRDPASWLHLIEWQRRQQWTPANMEATLKFCQEAITIAPDNAEAYFRGGEVLKSLGRVQEAMTMLRHALTLSPRLHDGAPNALLAQLEHRQGLLAESRYELSRDKQLNALRDPWPTQMELLYRNRPLPTLGEWKILGRLALDRHEPWVALCATTRALGLAPAASDCLAIRAAALSRLGRPDEALAAMRAARLLKHR